MVFLADVNFLIALVHQRHAASNQAVAWLGQQGEPITILLCRVAQMGVLRILTNPAWMKADVLPAADVWMGWDRLLTDDRFALVEEPARLEVEWRRLTRNLVPGRCADTDAYFAAFALAGSYRFLTFDRGFKRFDGLEVALVN